MQQMLKRHFRLVHHTNSQRFFMTINTRRTCGSHFAQIHMVNRTLILRHELFSDKGEREKKE
jgi:hypothetical protein